MTPDPAGSAIPPAGRTLKITLAYDGGPFVGWQRQADGPSIQGLVEEILARIEGGPVTVTGAGRTDAGVHAAAQVASAPVATPLPCATIARALNAGLPPEVRVLAVEDAAPGFHARFSARRKTYRYAIATGLVASPFVQRYAWHVPHALDVRAMAAAASVLEGRHDFAAFQSSGSSVTTAERTLFRSALDEVAAAPLPWLPASEHLLVYEAVGDGFLRHMVRTVAGTLVEVGAGRLTPGDVQAILASRSRARAGPTAPAAGLVLASVEY